MSSNDDVCTCCFVFAPKKHKNQKPKKQTKTNRFVPPARVCVCVVPSPQPPEHFPSGPTKRLHNHTSRESSGMYNGEPGTDRENRGHLAGLMSSTANALVSGKGHSSCPHIPHSFV